MADDPSGIPWPAESFGPISDEARAKSRAAAMAERPEEGPDEGPVWVFAYGSLMWRPCFEAAERRPGTVAGYRRSFCFWTMVARGTPERPGLGLGLEDAAGETCHGLAYRLSGETAESDLVALWDREMYSGVYVPRWVEVALDRPSRSGAARVWAITFVADPAHPQYCPPLSAAQQAEIIAGACGQFGSCAEYLESTVAHLAEFGRVEPEIEALQARVARLCAGRP